MADIQTIQSGSLQSPSREYIEYTKTTAETSGFDDVYVLRTLIDKVNELITEINILKNP